MMHDGTTDFLKLISTFIFIGVAVWWLSSVLGGDYTVLVIFALVGVVLFAGGALFSHANQKMTLDAITKFNAQDAQIDKYRQQSFKAMASGESAMQRAAAQLQVLDAKRVDKIAQDRAKLLTDTERERWQLQDQQRQQEAADTWTWGDDDNGAEFQEWR